MLLKNLFRFGAYFIVKPKDPITNERLTDAFYSTLCNDCDHQYIRQTRRQFGTHLKEQKAVFFCKKRKFSFVGAHMPN